MHTLWIGTRPWELYRWERCRENRKENCDPFPGLRDRHSALQWLQQFKNDTLGMSAIRDLVLNDTPAWQLCRMTDDNIVERMANLLSSGFWHVHAPPMRPYSVSSAPPQEETVYMAEPRRSPVRPKDPEPVEETLPPNADAAAIAQVLKSASAHGIPFCEECMKAALRGMNENGTHG